MTHQMTMCWHDAKPCHSKMTIFIVKMAVFEWKLLKMKYVLMNVYDFLVIFLTTNQCEFEHVSSDRTNR